MAKKIEESVLAALSAATFEGNEMRLVGTLDRQLYQKLAKVVEAAGGKWNRKAAAHVFDGDALDAMEPIFLTGEILRPSDLGQFDTPAAIVDQMIDLADIQPGMKVLEPSAGTGNILRGIRRAGGSARYCEIDPKRFAILKEIQPIGGIEGDFLAIDPDQKHVRFDRIVMNPPFAPKQADISHVQHAMRFLKPGGRLIAVMSAGVLFRSNSKTKLFITSFKEKGKGSIERLPDNSFKNAGTSVSTCLLVFDSNK